MRISPFFGGIHDRLEKPWGEWLLPRDFYEGDRKYGKLRDILKGT